MSLESFGGILERIVIWVAEGVGEGRGRKEGVVISLRESKDLLLMLRDQALSDYSHGLNIP